MKLYDCGRKNMDASELKRPNEIEMSKDLCDEFKAFMKKITGFKSDAELDGYLDTVIDNGNLQSIFDIAAREFNRFNNTNIPFEFHSWHNKHRLEFQQIENHIFISSNALVTLYCFYAILLYQADHLQNNLIKRKCFQNLLGILMDSCLYDCEPVAINAIQFVINEIGEKDNYLSLSGVLTSTSICFTFLHEMAHCYLHHNNQNDGSFESEFEADLLAYKVFLSIIERKNKGKFDGGLFTDSFQNYAYLSPAMFLGYIQTQKLTEIILFDKSSVEDKEIKETNACFDSFIKRKDQIINYIEESDADIDTDEGNCLYKGFELSLDSFADALIRTEEIGHLEEYKQGGWERKDEEQVKLIFVGRQKNSDELRFIDMSMLSLWIDCFAKPQEFTGVTIHRDEITGHVSKISNISFDLPEILKLALVSSLQIASRDPLVYMTLFVELIYTLFGKSKRLLEERDCKVLLSLKKLSDQGEPNIDDEKLKAFTKLNYPDLTDLDYKKAFRNLTHLGCISITDGIISLQEKVHVKYDY